MSSPSAQQICSSRFMSINARTPFVLLGCTQMFYCFFCVLTNLQLDLTVIIKHKQLRAILCGNTHAFFNTTYVPNNNNNDNLRKKLGKN